MRKIRAEKEFVLRWSGILTNGEPESLEGRDLTLYLINPYGSATAQDIEVENNTITSRISAGTCNVLGQYRLKLYANKGKSGQTVLDHCEGFVVVATTCQEGDNTPGLDIDTMELSGGDMAVGIQGKSAYEIAVENGFEGTEEEWLESLKGIDGKDFTYSDFTPEQIAELQRPAAEAAQLASQAASKANAAAQSATEAATTAAQTEASIKQAETARVSAEQQRQTSEQNRNQAEASRKQAESGRVTAEQGRVSSENGRVSAEQNRASAEQQRVTEFATLKQESETATTNANEAAEKANEATSGITDRLSETYPNLDAIKASGETNQDKIYIDAETNTSYRYNGSEFVSIGGGNQSELCYGVSYYANVIISDELASYINSCEAISVLFAVKCQQADSDWARYVNALYASNSNKLPFLGTSFDGSLSIFAPNYPSNPELKKYIIKYKNIISVDRVNGKSVGYNESGEFYNVTLERLKQPDFFVGNNLKTYRGDRNNAYIDYIIFNFDVSKIAFNPILLNYLRNIEKTGIIPQEFIHDSWSMVEKEKHVPNTYGEQWNRALEADGYYYKDIDQTEKATSISSSGGGINWTAYKAYQFIIRIEVIEGSIKCLNANNIMLADTAKFREVTNVNTGEIKDPSEEISVGTWDIIVDSIQEGTYGIYIKSVQVPAKIKCIKQSWRPYAAVLQLNGDSLYDGNKVYDTISKKMIQVDGATPGTLPFKSARYGTTAPISNEPPRFIGEKYYNTTTGDIYEAGNLTTFKKLNDA